MNAVRTEFAPAERADTQSISSDAELLRSSALVNHITDALPFIVLMLNRQRQVVYKNQFVMDFLGAIHDSEVLGKRPGNLLDCVHASQSEGGCGTTEFCRECGAVKAIMKSQREKIGVVEECRITTNSGQSYEFRVWATPYTASNRTFTVFSLQDIADQKRRQALERTFFHDINNLLTGIVGSCELIDTSTVSQDTAESLEAVRIFGKEMAEEIDTQRMLLEAEDGNLVLELSKDVSTCSLVDRIIDTASRQWNKRSVVRMGKSEDLVITTDITLLFRVLYNMLKNAIEASSADEVVSIGCYRDASNAVFRVHNPGAMPRPVQLQVFQRSFSTKGKGRGIGTYSMKLFGEKYLGGKVWFETSEDKGTTFLLSVPITYSDAP